MGDSGLNRNRIRAAALFLGWLILTMAVRTLDVDTVSAGSTPVGMSQLNAYALSLFGTHIELSYFADIVLTVSKVVGMLFICFAIRLMVIGGGINGLSRGMKALLTAYCVTGAAIGVFLLLNINAGPSGTIVPSYMAGKLLIPLVVMSTGIHEYHALVKEDENTVFAAQGFSVIIILVTVAIRGVSGQFWFTDILGACLFAGCVYYLYRWLCQSKSAVKKR